MVVKLHPTDYIYIPKGVVVISRNYLEIFHYDKWTNKTLPKFQEGELFTPSICELREGSTTSPSPLTEADLVGLMDKNGIGMRASKCRATFSHGMV